MVFLFDVDFLNAQVESDCFTGSCDCCGFKQLAVAVTLNRCASELSSEMCRFKRKSWDSLETLACL